MKDGLSVPALLKFLGYESARAVIAQFSPKEREQFAMEAARGEFSEEMTMRSVQLMGQHIAAYKLVARVGVTSARERLNQQYESACVDTVLDRVTTMAVLKPGEDSRDAGNETKSEQPAVIAHMLGYLPAEHACKILLDHEGGIANIAMVCEAAGLLEHLGEIFAQLEPIKRDELLDEVATSCPELATRMQVHLCGLVNILELDYHELADVLGGAAVEDIALALMAAEAPVQQRCINAMDGLRGAMLEAQLESPAPVQLSEMDAAAQRISCLVGNALDARFAPSYV